MSVVFDRKSEVSFRRVRIGNRVLSGSEELPDGERYVLELRGVLRLPLAKELGECERIWLRGQREPQLGREGHDPVPPPWFADDSAERSPTPLLEPSGGHAIRG